MQLFFIRHFESQANAAGILGGCLDYPLTESGREHAASAAERFLAGTTISTIISSPLTRARETAAPFAQLSGAAVRTDSALREQDMGIFSGKTYSWAEAHPAYEHDRAARWDWVPPGGESYHMIADRLRPFFLQLEQEAAENDRILVVTHAVTLRLVQALLERTLPSYPVALARNGEIIETDYQGLGHVHSLQFRYCGQDRDSRE
jgi:broad specificity phosphatase PhoE